MIALPHLLHFRKSPSGTSGLAEFNEIYPFLPDASLVFLNTLSNFIKRRPLIVQIHPTPKPQARLIDDAQPPPAPQGQENRTGATQVDSLVPLANMFGYATDLRSSTQGRGQYSMEPHSYVQIPKNIAEKIVAERGRNQD